MRYALLLLLALGACSNYSTKTVDTTGAAKAAYEAKAAYGVALVAATAYARLPRCPAAQLCSDPAVLTQMKKADIAADAATQAAENAVRTMGSNPTAVSAAVTASTQAVAALQALTSTYAPKGT